MQYQDSQKSYVDEYRLHRNEERINVFNGFSVDKPFIDFFKLIKDGIDCIVYVVDVSLFCGYHSNIIIQSWFYESMVYEQSDII